MKNTTTKQGEVDQNSDCELNNSSSSSVPAASKLKK